MNDLRKLKVGDPTNQGIIKRIFGSGKDYLVFENNEGESKVLNTGTDERFNKAIEEAKRLDAEAYRKFKGVHRHVIKELSSFGLVSALKNTNIKTDFKKNYKGLIEFIKNSKRVKHIFGEGPTPQHIVYLNEDNCVGVELKPLPDHIKPALNELTTIKHLIENGLPKLFRSSPSEIIGRTMVGVIRSTPETNLDPYVLEAKKSVEIELKDFFHMEHQLISIVLIVVLFLFAILIEKKEYTFFEIQLLTGAIGGALGAMISNLQRATRDLFGLQEKFLKLLLQSLSRLILGAISGSIIIPLSKSNLALGFIQDNLYSLFIFGIIAGISERFIPDILGGLSKGQNK